MFVHALEELLVSTSQLPEKKLRWVIKDAHSLADRVLFLGLRNSFALDAAQLGNNHGGCVYFIYHNVRMVPHDVFRYNLVDGKARLVERLPQCWDPKMCTWFNPESIITPLHQVAANY